MGAKQARMVPTLLVLTVLLGSCTTGTTPSEPAPASAATVSSDQGSSAHPSGRSPSVSPSRPEPPSLPGTLSSSSSAPSRPAGTVTTSSDDTSPAAGSQSSLVAGSAEALPDSVTEASGVAVSTLLPDTYFVVDDASGTDELVAVNGDGSLVSRIRVAGMEAANAEALASAPCEPTGSQNCLYVGDIGDHSGRDSITVYRVTEPTGDPWFADSVAWQYTYSDGPTNAEALLVAPDGELLIISKPTADQSGKMAPHRIYRGPPGGGTLEQVGSFDPPAPRLPVQSLVTGTVVTDAAYDGRRVLVLTYDQVIAYTAPDSGADPAGFPDWPQTRLPVPRLEQPEGIASLPDGCGFVAVSEAAISKAGAIAVSVCDG